MRDLIVTVNEERAVQLIEKLARFVAERHLAAPALIATEMFQPFNHIGSQFLYMILPVAELVFDSKAYQEFAALIEEDKYMKMLSKRIDELDEELHKDRYENNRLKRKKRNEKLRKIFMFWKK
ncbi:MAG: hypothetical protein B6226_01525 [Candidatus Cloacimonetes bacterium 4572_65]|nr:MAG: hypothetical protein B6226_01525 [Candidatus Cloacimonetes bacterium 4572_65]